MLKIKVENVKDGFIIGGGKTEAGKDRIVPILPCIKPFVEYFLSKNDTYLMQITPGKAKKPIDLNNWRKRHFNKALLKCGILKDENDHHVTPISARKTFASMLSTADVNNVAITKMMGHADISTTETYYISKDTQELIVEIEKIESYFGLTK